MKNSFIFHNDKQKEELPLQVRLIFSRLNDCSEDEVQLESPKSLKAQIPSVIKKESEHSYTRHACF